MKRYFSLVLAIALSLFQTVQPISKDKIKYGIQSFLYSTAAATSAIICFGSLRSLNKESLKHLCAPLKTDFNPSKGFCAQSARLDIALSVICGYSTYRFAEKALEKFEKAKKA